MTGFFSLGFTGLIVASGFAWMFKGPKAAWSVFSWPFKAGFKLSRKMMGGLLVSIGNAIKP